MACTVDQQQGTFNDNRPFRDDADRLALGQQFTPTVTGGVCRVDVRLWKSGTPTGDVWIEIWSDTGADLPNAQIGGDSSTVDVTTLNSTSGTATFESFTWVADPAITSGTKYWIVVSSDVSISASDFLRVGTSGGAASGRITVEDSGNSWAADSEGIDMEFDQYDEAAAVVQIKPPAVNSTGTFLSF